MQDKKIHAAYWRHGYLAVCVLLLLAVLTAAGCGRAEDEKYGRPPDETAFSYRSFPSDSESVTGSETTETTKQATTTQAAPITTTRRPTTTKATTQPPETQPPETIPETQPPISEYTPAPPEAQETAEPVTNEAT